MCKICRCRYLKTNLFANCRSRTGPSTLLNLIPTCVLGFSPSWKQNWSKIVVSLLDLKNMHLDLEIHDMKHVGIEFKFYNLDTFKKQVDVNFIDLNSKLVDIWIIKLHLWYFVTFGVALYSAWFGDNWLRTQSLWSHHAHTITIPY